MYKTRTKFKSFSTTDSIVGFFRRVWLLVNAYLIEKFRLEAIEKEEKVRRSKTSTLVNILGQSLEHILTVGIYDQTV
jgi:hypothetical protein